VKNKTDEEVSRMSADNHYDAIIIGSGLGGLTTASILAKLQYKRVLILERHYVVGGLTHVFKRPGNHEWDVGIHYIGEMEEGSTMRAIFDFITEDQLEWTQMPDEFDKFVYPDMTFAQKSDRKRFKQDLVDRFPSEKDGIESYFADLRLLKKWNYFRLLAEGNKGALHWFFKRQKEKIDPPRSSTATSVIPRSRLLLLPNGATTVCHPQKAPSPAML
jgi:all-trans-retinol 13,14-reductase